MYKCFMLLMFPSTCYLSTKAIESWNKPLLLTGEPSIIDAKIVCQKSCDKMNSVQTELFFWYPLRLQRHHSCLFSEGPECLLINDICP